jgi:C4-dicarboxylate-specific signal transduction histidine kinase
MAAQDIIRGSSTGRSVEKPLIEAKSASIRGGGVDALGSAGGEIPPGPPRHLLIVDDELVIIQILRAVFEDEPYRITTAATGRDALRIIEEQGCDLLISDKNLPDISGLDLLRAARTRNRFAEVIIITGYGSLETAIKALELGAFDYVLKPLDNVFDIRKKVRRAVEKQTMAIENHRLLEHLQRKNAELEVALAEATELRAELIQSEKLAGIGTLAAGVAHEVSSPLFGVMGLAEAIAEEEDIEVAQVHARDIVDYCRTIRDIVVELTSYSRAATTEVHGSVELARVVDDALRLVERSAAVGGVSFVMELPLGLMLAARSTEIQQVFVNLIKNGAEAVLERFGASGAGEVRVTAGRVEGWVWARVSDNGVGIPADRLGVVFDPFFTTKAPGKGTGLGLNVVYRIVTKYRGTIQVESVVGQGTTFLLRLPG